MFIDMLNRILKHKLTHTQREIKLCILALELVLKHKHSLLISLPRHL